MKAPGTRRPPQDPPAGSLADLVRWATGRLTSARLHYGHGTDNPADEAAWLVAHSAGIRPPVLTPAALARPAPPALRQAVAGLVAERIQTRRPAAYLLGEAWFGGLPFHVDERVLVPRSHLAEAASAQFASLIDPARVRRILEIGTGSGCLAVVLARAFPAALVDAADVSPAALEVARRNVARHRLGRRIRLVRSDIYAGLPPGRRYDLIVSNPPYVPDQRIGRFPPEYQHEPRLALAGGADGLDLVERLLDGAGARLTPHGLLALEVGGTRAGFEARWPRLPVVWLATSYGEPGIFAVRAGDLAPRVAGTGGSQ